MTTLNETGDDLLLSNDNPKHASSPPTGDQSDKDQSSDSSTGSSSSSTADSSSDSSDQSESDELGDPVKKLIQASESLTSEVKQVAVEVGVAESDDQVLDASYVSNESYLSADVTLTRKLESELIEDSEEVVLVSEVLLKDTMGKESGKLASADAAGDESISTDKVMVTKQESLVVAVAPSAVSAVGSEVVVESADPAVGVIIDHSSTVPVIPCSIKPGGRPEAESGHKEKDKVKLAEKDKKTRKRKKKSERNRKRTSENQSSDDQDKHIKEGEKLARMVANFMAASDKRAKGSPRRKKNKRKAVKSRKSSKSKRTKYSESRSKPESDSSKSAPDVKPQPAPFTNIIVRLSKGKIFQRQAMERAKFLGLSKDDNERVVQLTKALKIAEGMEFLIEPSMAYPDFNSVLGTGLPHIQVYVQDFRDKYGPLAKAITILNLTIERNKILSKGTLVGPEQSNQFLHIWQFRNTLKCAVPSSVVAMNNSVPRKPGLAPACRSSASSASVTKEVAIDFSQISEHPSTSKMEPVSID